MNSHDSRSGALSAAQHEPPWPGATSGAGVELAWLGGELPCLVASDELREVFDLTRRVASSSLPVLIIGETGTGKELAATSIHRSGRRAHEPFVVVNCGSLTPELLQSAFFGHEKGAFTGAGQQAIGFVERAHRGTMFLDEIGELPPEGQAALLRVLETKRFCRVGSTRELGVDVRFVAATHRNLEAMVRQGQFRQDLLYRLNAITLEVPPLRQRRSEIAPLAELFLRSAVRAGGLAVDGIDDAAMACLMAYPWPGNVRELRFVIERSVTLCDTSQLTLAALPERVVLEASRFRPWSGEAEPWLSTLSWPMNMRDELRGLETALITKALRKARWNRRRAAEMLGVPLRTLTHRIHRLEIEGPA